MQRRVLIGIWLVSAVALAIGAPVTRAQGPVSGVFFDEGWESGAASQSFNSRFYGNAGTSTQFGVDSTIRAGGARSLRHSLTAGLGAGAIHYATQHFGDATSGPIHPAGAGQSFHELYIQYKIYYSPGFDLAGAPKQIIVGTEDSRRHENVCCNPWVSHYLTVVPPHTSRGPMASEINNKQAASGQWHSLVQNRSGYSPNNLFITQSGRWYTVEVHMRLNDASGDNGVFRMWIDGALISEHSGLRYRVPWNGTFGADMNRGTNFVLISNYMANGSSRDQSVYYDDMKFSTTYIGTGGSTLPSAPTNLRIVPGSIADLVR